MSRYLSVTSNHYRSDLMLHLNEIELASALVVSLLLYICSKPMLQGASRITEFLITMFGAGVEAKRRNILVSSEMSPDYQDIIADTVIRDPVIPGVLLYAFAYLNSAQSLTDPQTLSFLEIVVTLSIVLAFTFFRILASLSRSATKSRLPISHSLSAIAFICAFALGILLGMSLEAIAAAFIVSLFVSAFAAATSRGFRNYGVFCFFWIPVATFCWLTRVFSLAIAAPLILPICALEIYLERPDQTQ